MEIVKCDCGYRFPNNPMKHQGRKKLCPRCGTPYTKKGINWKPNLNWLKNKTAQWKRPKKSEQSLMPFLGMPRFTRGFRPGKAPIKSPIILPEIDFTADQVKGEIQKQIQKEKADEIKKLYETNKVLDKKS